MDNCGNKALITKVVPIKKTNPMTYVLSLWMVVPICPLSFVSVSRLLVRTDKNTIPLVRSGCTRKIGERS